MATQRSPKNGSLVWEDDSASEVRFRRAQQVTPRTGRNLPGMPLEVDDPDDDSPRPRRRFDEPQGRWWRPATKLGRILLGAGILAVAAALVAGYVTTSRFLKHDSRFRITGLANIQSNGLMEVPRDEIVPVFGADVGKNIFFVHLGERRKQLEQIPWVEHATVMRLLPDHIRISVVERKPVAFVRIGQQVELVDGNGVLLSISPATIAKHRYSFPVVTGIDPGDSPASRQARMAVYQHLISELDSNGQHLSNRISEVDLTDPEDARVLMPEAGADILAHFGDEQFLSRYQRYQAHIAEWRAQYPKLAAVDLRYDQQVVLQMSGDNPAQTTIAGEATNPLPAPADPVKPSPAGKPEVSHKLPAALLHTAHAKSGHKQPSKTKKRKHPNYSRAGLTHHKAIPSSIRQE